VSLAASLDGLLADFATGVPPVAISGMSLDSRAVRPGDAFFAVKGSRGHGLAHAGQAIAQGASAIVWEPAENLTAPQFAVASVPVDRLSWHVGEIAARFFGDPSHSMFVAGITGTDGKTSTAWLIARAFEQLSRPCGYIGTLGQGRHDRLDESRHTTPDPITLQSWLWDFKAEGIDACAMEVSSHALDQNRVGGTQFDAAVLTNVTRDHLDYHGTVDAYASAKRRLFEAHDDRALIFNRDDATGARWASEFGPAAARLVLYGLDGPLPEVGRHVIGRDLALGDAGLSMDIDTSWGPAHIESHLLGRFNAYNLLAALAVLLEAGVELEQAADALSASRTVPGRIEGYRGPRAQPLVVVDYAHTPQALEQVLQAVRAHTRGRLWCVFGCGGDRDRGKRPLMGEVASRLADRVIVTDDNPRSEDPTGIVAEILRGVAPGRQGRIVVEHDRERAIRLAVSLAHVDDTVLIAGKGHETTQTYRDQVRAFSDRKLAAELTGAGT
jgi:UDP-N-acetylmuramoyl-L-alanyl-D-glutamate--2,6-diaminopimelate ligase